MKMAKWFGKGLLVLSLYLGAAGTLLCAVIWLVSDPVGGAVAEALALVAFCMAEFGCICLIAFVIVMKLSAKWKEVKRECD